MTLMGTVLRKAAPLASVRTLPNVLKLLAKEGVRLPTPIGD
jgi:hypothetical protein